MTNPDCKDLLAVFFAHDVRYMVVGGYAVAFHARPRFTKDLDLWIEPSEDNAARAFAALQDFAAPLTEMSSGDLTDPEVVYQIGVPPNRIDILTSVSGLAFADAWKERVESSYDGVRVFYLSKSDLVRNKRSAARPQDLIDADLLEED